MDQSNDEGAGMQISSESRNVLELFPISGNICYRIPPYQRGYSWRDEQIEQLFDDIRNEGSGYYAGNILLTGDTDSLSVIDGQQRLTTISLMLLAIGEKLISFSTIEAAIVLKGDIKRQLFNSNNEPRIQLLDQDQKIYVDLLGSLFDKHRKKWGNRSFYKRYRFIRGLLDECFDSFSSLNEFYQKLMETNLLRITVPDLGDAFNVFSSLNSKGLPLTLIDLLKGEFLSAAQKIGEQTNQTLTEWDSLSQVLSSDGEDTNTSVVTQFLLNNWDAFESDSSSSTTKTKALSQYQRLLKKKYSGGENYLQTLIRRAEVFARIIQLQDYPTDAYRLGKKLSDLRRLESTQALPLLMYLCTRQDELCLDDADLDEILDSLIAFYVRRNVVLSPKSSNIRARLIGVVRTLQNEKVFGSDIVALIQGALHDLSASDEQFRAALNQPIYDKNETTARYILIALERNVGGCPTFDKGHPDSLDQFVIGPGGKSKPIWTIEHVLPEGHLPKWWVNDLANGNESRAEELQDELVHLLGNLTLTPYNSELGQKPFYSEDHPYDGSKRDYKDKQTNKFVGLRSGLFLNESIADVEHGELLESKRAWTADDIRRRNDVLADLVVNLYRLK